ncbi:hypothetical protein FKM82_024777 [Ascaphus truei]
MISLVYQASRRMQSLRRGFDSAPVSSHTRHECRLTAPGHRTPPAPAGQILLLPVLLASPALASPAAKTFYCRPRARRHTRPPRWL